MMKTGLILTVFLVQIVFLQVRKKSSTRVKTPDSRRWTVNEQ